MDIHRTPPPRTARLHSRARRLVAGALASCTARLRPPGSLASTSESDDTARHRQRCTVSGGSGARGTASSRTPAVRWRLRSIAADLGVRVGTVAVDGEELEMDPGGSDVDRSSAEVGGRRPTQLDVEAWRVSQEDPGVVVLW